MTAREGNGREWPDPAGGAIVLRVSEAIQYSYHLFEAREFRERFLLAVQGDEAIGKELLEAAGKAEEAERLKRINIRNARECFRRYQKLVL